MPSPIPPCGLARYPKSGNSAQTAFSLTAGLKSLAAVNPLEFFAMRGTQGLKIMIGGAGADISDNDACDYRIWIGDYTLGVDDAPTGIDLQCFGYGTATFSAAAFIGGVAASAAGRMADQITFQTTVVGGTPEGPGAVIEAAYSVAGGSYGPDSDIPAKLYLPHLGWPDLVIVEFDQTTGSPDGMFALIGRV